MIRHAFALCAFLVAGPALAQGSCPTGTDLDRGIRIEFPDGTSETYRRVGEGVVNVLGRETDGHTYTMSLGRGFHLLSWEAQGDPGSRIAYDYGVAPESLPLPAPGTRWRTAVTVTTVDGTRQEPQTHAYGALTPVTIGGCTYRSIESIIAYATKDHYAESVIFLPDLGFGYLLWNEADGMERSPVAPVAIRAGK